MTTGLLDGALRIAIILGVGAGAVWWGRRRSAAIRHWMLAASIGGALALPALALVWPASLRPGWPVPTIAGPLAPTPRNAAEAPAPVAARPPRVEVEVTSVQAGVPEVALWSRVRVAVLWLWAVGVLLACARLARGLRGLRRLAAAARQPDDHSWHADCDTLRARIYINTPVRLLVGDDSTPVVTWGWRRPAILLPASARDWPTDRREVVLAHELSHVARHDWLMQLGAEVLRALHWYQPLAWWACRQLRDDSERATDDVVLAHGVDAVVYAEHLLDLARAPHRAPRSWIPAPAMARPSSLEGRVRAMLDPTIDRRSVARPTRALVAAAAALAVCAAASLGARQTQFYALRGSVVDSTNRAVPNVALVLTHPTSSAKHEVRTDASGRFEFVGLPPATYGVSVTALGFRARADVIAITSDSERQIQVAVAPLQETITVAPEAASPAPTDAVEEQERTRQSEARLARAKERQARALTTCASGPPTAIGGNILPPIKLVSARPMYPASLAASALAGQVTMRAVIDRDGNVRDVTDVAGPHPALDTAAVDAVRQWKFTTTLLNCEPIEVEMRVTVNFNAAR